MEVYHTYTYLPNSYQRRKTLLDGNLFLKTKTSYNNQSGEARVARLAETKNSF